jgi:hypothetical protein
LIYLAWQLASDEMVFEEKVDDEMLDEMLDEPALVLVEKFPQTC